MNASLIFNWNYILVMVGITLVEIIFMGVLIVDALSFKGQIHKSKVVQDLFLILGLAVLVQSLIHAAFLQFSNRRKAT
jgi:hypothetical protein